MRRFNVNLTRTLVTFAFAASTLLCTSTQAVPMGPTYTFNSHEYTLVAAATTGGAQTWGVAEADAVAWGGHLVAINDAAEQAFLTGQWGQTGVLWIGFTDQITENIFQWTNGEPSAYTNWYPGEPNDYNAVFGGEDYAVMNWAEIPGSWNDCSPDGVQSWSCAGSSGEVGYLGIAERATAVPAPATLALLGAGLLGLSLTRRKK